MGPTARDSLIQKPLSGRKLQRTAGHSHTCFWKDAGVAIQQEPLNTQQYCYQYKYIAGWRSSNSSGS